MGKKLYDEVRALLADGGRREEMSRALRQLVVPDSAQRICDMIEQLSGEGHHGK